MTRKTIVWTGKNQIEMSDFIGHEHFWHNRKGELLIREGDRDIILPKGGTLIKSDHGIFETSK
jgi:hypothetical protein